jgi:hypothetical protein
VTLTADLATQGARRPAARTREFSPLRLLVGLTIAAHVMFGGWSAHRALWQVRDLDVQAPPGAVRRGWRPLIRVTTSGWKDVRVLVVLAQGARADTVAVHRIGGHRNGFWNPSFISRTFSPRVTTRQASHFEAGPATLRVEAHASAQWPRTPEPVIREIPVRVASLPPAPQPATMSR